MALQGELYRAPWALLPAEKNACRRDDSSFGRYGGDELKASQWYIEQGRKAAVKKMVLTIHHGTAHGGNPHGSA